MLDRQRWILSLLPFFFLPIIFWFSHSQTNYNPAMLHCLFLSVWMVVWWVFEILPLGITALLPMIYLPLSGTLAIKEVAPYYSNPVIYLFLGGFIIARALEKTKLDERLALNILKRTGHSDKGIVLGFILATTFLSMWISNTATTVMMLPIALSVTHYLKSNYQQPDKMISFGNFNTVLFLSIAYSANIGGVTTPVGTPPNVVFMGYLQDLYSQNIDFYKWTLATLPAAALILAIMFYLLNWLFPYNLQLTEDFNKFITEKLNQLGELSSAQKITLSVFSIATFLWVLKGPIHFAVGQQFLNDTSIALTCALLLFLIPNAEKDWKPVLSSSDIGKLPWDIVLLFGGGMALANSLNKVGLIQSATDYFASLSFSSPYYLIFVMAAVALFLTEIMSNVALCVVALPLIMSLGEAQGLSPIAIALPAALATSFAFSMPISTPPNAIVFSSNQIKVSQMLRAGLILNIVALLSTMSLGYLLISWILVP